MQSPPLKLQLPSWLSALALLLSGCSDSAPICPFPGGGDEAPTAACFSVVDNSLLVIQGLNGKIGLPGGLSKSGESSRCAAFRETWEETGLQLQPAELLQVVSNDLHLYRCDPGEQPGTIDPPLGLEVRAVFYLPFEQIDDYEWRFKGEREVVSALLSDDSLQDPAIRSR